MKMFKFFEINYKNNCLQIFLRWRRERQLIENQSILSSCNQSPTQASIDTLVTKLFNEND